ncbi:MAG: cyclase family protein [Saprospiraceae bacterium]|nr:cyclase family protein [Candidatus Vicinibacter affinis]MBK8640962.1 cyclase family protein [Candidatus Vicinibacter affinis]MBK9959978.1 cyclase family protein [Candidatus Vicinibacter affinis]
MLKEIKEISIEGTIVIDLNKAVDISISFKTGIEQVNCFYAPFFDSIPVKAGAFIGSVKEGGPVNFSNVKLNVHGNGTHTECVGHITDEFISVNEILKNYVFKNHLCSVYPTKRDDGDLVIERFTLEQLLADVVSETLTIRTLPNPISKKKKHYSGTNPTYLSEEAMEFIVQKGFKHILVDFPSVDREEDEGRLLAHRAFWKGERAKTCTITELVYVPEDFPDGDNMLFLHLAPLDLDAVPSRPILYRLKNDQYTQK